MNGIIIHLRDAQLYMGFLPGGTPKSSKLSEYFSNETHGDLGIPHRNPGRRRVALLLEEFLYAFHSGIEALAGSLLVIRGRGAMDTLQAWVGTR
jgi:hypothetical protein